MSNTDGTSQETGSTALSEQEAVDRIASLLSDDGDSDGGETQEDESSEAEDDAEGDEPEAEDSEESEEPDDADDSEGQPQSLTVKIDGEDVTVTLDELKSGYSRTQDYTRKTMALADERKAFEGEKAKVSQERETYTQALARLGEFFQSAEDDSATLAELRHSNPAEYAARIAEKQQRQQSLQLIQAEQHRIAAEKAREEAGRLAQHAKAEEDKLLKALPEWAKPETRSAEQARLVDYAITTLGLSPDEVSQIYDHRLVLALHKAAKWDALQAKKPAVQAKVSAVKAAKPGSAAQQPSRVTEATRAKQRLAKTGRVEDAARALEHILG